MQNTLLISKRMALKVLLEWVTTSLRFPGLPQREQGVVQGQSTFSVLNWIELLEQI